MKWLQLNFSRQSVLFKLVLVLTIVFLVYAVLSTSILWIEPTDWGLVNRLPPVYYAGLFLLGILWYIGVKSKSYLPAALILTVGYLYVAPALIRVPVWTSNSYYPFGESLLINSSGHLPTGSPPTIGNYHYWPLFLYFSSTLTTVTGVPHDILLKFFPLFTVSMYGLLAVLILRIKLAPQLAFLGVAWILASLFIRQQYFGPQAIAYIFFLLIILVVSRLFFTDEAHPRTMAVLLFLLFVVTTLIHPLTSFMSMIVLAAGYLANRVLKRKISAPLGLLTLGAVIVWVGYNSFIAITFFREAIEHFFEIFAGTREISLYSQPSRIIGSTAQRINFVASWAIVGLGVIVALLSIVHIVRKLRAKHSVATYWVFSAALLIMVGLFGFFGEYGPQESFTRAFMFGLLPLSFLCVSFLARKPKLIVALITVLLFLNIPAQYGSDNYRLATDTQLSGTAFLASYTPDDISIVGELTLYIKYHNPLKNYTILSLGLAVPITEAPNSTRIAEGLSTTDYIIISDLQHNYFMFYLGEDPLEEQAKLQILNRAYDNGRFQLLSPMNASND